MESFDLLDMVRNYSSISIIGMAKNVGKTTVLNYLLNEAKGNITLGLTSIGRDGEEIDLVNFNGKPKIHIYKNTLIATAKQCLLTSDITIEILKTTNLQTPMGEIIIIRALSDGYIELAGPSISNDIKNICNELKKLGADLVIVDGALSRKTFASPSITEATVLSTGASLDKNMNKVVTLTHHTVNLLTLKQENNKNILKICKSQLKDCRVALINKNMQIKKLNLLTTLESSQEVLNNIENDTTHIVLNGIITDNFLHNIVSNLHIYKKITVLIEDGTKAFISNDTLLNFQLKGGSLKVMDEINLICVTYNPYSPGNYYFPDKDFKDELKEFLHIPVVNVKLHNSVLNEGD